MTVDGDGWTEVTNPQPDVYLQTHGPKACAGKPCCVHAPSAHHMIDWPLVHRTDHPLRVVDLWDLKVLEVVLSARVCEHEVEHPDPDSLAYVARTFNGAETQAAVHGCDGCCRLPEESE